MTTSAVRGSVLVQCVPLAVLPLGPCLRLNAVQAAVPHPGLCCFDCLQDDFGRSCPTASYRALLGSRSTLHPVPVVSMLPSASAEVVLTGSPLTHEFWLRRDRGTYGAAISAQNGSFPGSGTPVKGLYRCRACHAVCQGQSTTFCKLFLKSLQSVKGAAQHYAQLQMILKHLVTTSSANYSYTGPAAFKSPFGVAQDVLVAASSLLLPGGMASTCTTFLM